MNKNNNETSILIKPVYPRHISLDENIHTALTIHSYSLYTVLRFQADFRKEDSEVQRTAEFLYTKAKIKKSQYYISMNELEEHGLVLRDPENKLGEKCVIHVARELGYFNRGVSDRDRGVHTVDRGVHTVDTDHISSFSSNINITTSVSNETNSSPSVSNQEIVDAYNEHLPQLTKIKVIDRDLSNKITFMKKNWHKYQKEGKTFTLELFIDFLEFIKVNHKWFLNPRVTDSGSNRKNSLRNLIAEKNIARFANGEFSGN